MPLETAVYISQLNQDWPLGADDESEGDDHLRLIKATMQSTWPNASAPFSADPVLLNGITEHLTYQASDGTHPERFETHNAAYDAQIPIRAGLGTAAQMNAMPDLVINWSVILNMLYPVGSVVINTGTNPANTMGFGTWTQRSGWLVGAGVITDSDGYTNQFGAGPIAGNFMIHQENMIPFSVAGSGSTSASGNHQHPQRAWNDNAGSTNPYIDRNTYTNPNCCDTSTYTEPAGDHTHTVSVTSNIGTATAQHMPPSWSFFIWERSA